MKLTSRIAYVVAALALAPLFAFVLGAHGAPLDPCTDANEIACENSKPGNHWSEWDVDGDGDPTIQGFADGFSFDRGETVRFKIKTPADAYSIEVFRLGYYGGAGARKVATLTPSAALPQTQPECLTDPTGLIDCGNWAVSATWEMPADATSGVYVARPVRTDTGGASHIPFIVRDDDGGSDLLFQTADTTWQAYNRYGGNSLYVGNNNAVGAPSGRAYKVSYNRPFNVRVDEPRSWLFASEHAMIRWIERNGYDVSYTSGVDTARRGAELLEHHAFLSVGHDEYWSGDQRANIEAARDAGVHLAFFSGNDVFWKHRWEPAIDGTGAPFRTLVTYKESAANAKIDPHPTWTGRWRDARFSPPSDGGRPENALTGTLFQVQFRDDPIHVPAADGRMRFWRHTSIASLPAGDIASLPEGVLGYEWNEVPDNGLSPPGLVFLSDSTFTTEHYDSGQIKPVTHHLTLHRRPSGALVFSAGSIGWAFGLDEVHDGGSGIPEDERMQQATANLFADMGAQPTTIQPTLVVPSQTTDATPPVTTITSPTAGQVIPRGERVTVTGTAADGAGAVGVVEVSLDGGSTWHRATGRTSWTYTGNMSGFGDVPIKVRATDDSGNTESPPASVVVSAGPCPCSLWPDSARPAEPSTGGSAAIEVGLKFRSSVDGYVTGIRFYKGAANTGAHTGHLWSKSGALLGEVTFTGESATGWQTATFPTPIGINAGATYVISYFAPNGNFALTRPYFGTPYDNAPLHAPADGGAAGANGVYKAGSSGFPSSNFGASNYWVDVVFAPEAADSTRPRVEHVTPRPGAWRADLNGDVTVGFSEAIRGSTVTSATFELRGPDGDLVPAAVAYDSENTVARLNPTEPLQQATTYTALIRGGAGGVADLAGNTLSENYQWTFKTERPGSCPCTIWPDSATPATAAVADGNGYEVGVKFRADTNGFIKGLRFYKGSGNTGTHVGHLWSASGQMIAEAVFFDETPTGWQEVEFGAPIAISGGTTYVASYFAPNGRYALTRPFFGSGPVDAPPLHALADGASGPNGIYRLGAGFPTSSHMSSNYWVDVIFDTDGTDRVAPRVVSTYPLADAQSIAVAKNVVASFSEGVAPGTVNGSTFELRGPNGAIVPAAVSYDAASRTAILDPVQPLALSTTYTATVRGGSSGVADPAGNRLAADQRWSFTTAVPRVCPCSLWSDSTLPAIAADSATGPHELGVKFRSDLDGYITGIRFYKGSGNTGTHVGRLWSATGTELARVTFTGESETGWQYAAFDTPVAISAHTTYVASYFAPVGRFAVTRPYFNSDHDNGTLHALASETASPNGVYRSGSSGFPTATYRASNYWVDVVYEATVNDTKAPRVLGTTPVSGATKVSRTTSVTAQMSEPVDPATVGASTFELRAAGTGALVTAAVSYTAPTATLRLQPSAALAESTTYTATVKGGPSGVRDLSGNALAADHAWSFTTLGAAACPCSLWSGANVPATVDVGDGGSYELGVKFQAESSGYVTGIRFYKSSLNTGTHVGRLWTASGTPLASATFTNETTSGWQQVNFAAPVAVSANTTYVASYSDPNGHFSRDRAYFGSAFESSPLRALASGASGGNGVYGARGSFPTASFDASNYWVDVVFALTDATPPSVVATTPAAGATRVATGTAATAQFSKAMDPATVTASTFELRDASNAIVSAAVSYDAATRTATLTPSAALAPDATYTARVRGGAGGVKDSSGNALTADHSWSFTTLGPSACPCSLWNTLTMPGTVDAGDGGAYELGVKFQSEVPGYVTGIRFYKSSLNTGTHVGRLWTAAGLPMASATFTNETASGWQQVTFASPVAISANTTYVASYSVPNGHFSRDRPYFGSAYTNSPLRALASGASGGNGVYGALGGFPTASFDASNYWVDVVFTVAP